MSPTQTIFVLIYLLTVLLSATVIVPLSVAALVGALLTAWFGARIKKRLLLEKHYHENKS